VARLNKRLALKPGSANHATPASASMQTATKVVYVAPVDRRGRPAASDIVTETVTGSCEEGSDVVAGPVYRCLANPGPADRHGGIADPCMAAVYDEKPTRTVLCMLDPWSRDVVKIVTRGLPKSPGPFAPGLTDPLGVRLTTGQDCLAAQGAHDEYRGRAVDYYCTGHPTLELLRGAHQSREPWTFDSVTDTPSGDHRPAPPVSVATAWYEGWPPAT
jgi:hypothetical protein